MRTSETVIEIAKALVKAQAKIKHALKDATNPHLRNEYSTIESVIDATKEALMEQGIVVIQSPTSKTLTTRLQHVSGEFYEDTMELLLTKQDMQGLGSAITYARRYMLSAMTNIAQADDDGNGTAKKKSPKPVTAKPPPSKNDTLPF